MTDSGRTSSTASRRTVVGGIVGLGVSTPLLAACGSDESSGDSGSSGGTDSGSNSGGTDSGSSGGSASGGIAKTSDVPVGSGKIFTDEKVLVSQPEAGQFKAFSTVCTHQKCAITELKGEEIECTCHHSKFSIVDGSNTQGPNNTDAGSVQPLEELKVTVTGDQITVA